MYDILIIGGGYAGLWAAFSAARQADACARPLQVGLIASSPWLTARVRLYEAGLPADDARQPLQRWLDAVGVTFQCGDVTGIAPQDGGRDAPLRVQLRDGRALTARVLVFAAGSQLARPPIPGLAEHAFDIDTADAAERTWERLHALAPGAQVDIVGGSFTGIEFACELAGWRRQHNPTLRLRLSDAGSIAQGYSPAARAAVLRTLGDLGVHCAEHAALGRCDAGAVQFTGTDVRRTDMLVWTAGMVPSPLAAQVAAVFGVPRHTDGRLAVDARLALPGAPGVFAAGDVAAALVEGNAYTTLSCQHAISTGTFAGHNAVNHACGMPLIDYVPPYPYGTCLDLGPAGAMITRGFTRELVAVGEAVKATKQHINRSVIVPPRDGGREALFAIATVEVPEGAPASAALPS